MPLPSDTDASLLAIPTLVGREREQRLLRQRLDAACAGHGSLALIGGEAGIGKTTLAEAICREAASMGISVFTGRCYDLTETPPYGPWSELFGHHADPPALFAAVSTGITSQAAIFAAAHASLRAMVSERPAVLLLDDLHWADPASLDLLRPIARGLAALPVLLLVTYRIDELTDDHPLRRLLPILVREVNPLRLTLRPLDGEAVRALIRARYGIVDDGEDRLRAYLHDYAEGNPFFIGELLYVLEEEGHLPRTAAGMVVGDLTHLGVSPVLRQMIARRVERLGGDAQVLLAVAAIIGPDVPLALWMRVTGSEESALLDLLERAVAARLLVEAADGTSVQFAHALVREVLYTGMLAARRRGWHRAVAEALLTVSSPDPDAVAYHLQQALDERAGEWLVRAGDRANRAFAYQTAVARFTDALAVVGDDAAHTITRCELLIRLARLLRITDTARAIEHEEEALRLATEVGDEILQAVARFRLGYLLSYVGQRQRGLVLQLAGLAALDALPQSAMARILPLEPICADLTSRHGSVAQRLVQIGCIREAEAHADRALAAVGGVLNRAAEDAWMALAITDREMGRPDDGWRRSFGLYTLFRERGEHDIASWLVGSPLIWAALAYQTDDRARLREMRALLDSRAPQSGELFATLPIRALHLPVLYVEGAWAEARQIIEAVRRRPFAHHAYTHGVWLVHALIAIAQGEADAAWAMVREEFPSGAVTGPGNHRYDVGLFIQRIAITLALEAGDLPEARAWLETHDRWLAWSGAVLGKAEGHLLWARHARASGDDLAARERALLARASASAPRQPLILIAVYRLLGELATAAGRCDDAEQCLNDALALAKACASPYEAALTLLARAELRAACGDTTAVPALLQEVQTLGAPLGARPLLDRAAALATRHALPAPPCGQRPSGELTGREVEILRLLAAGGSNRGIGTTLGIATRTVERHISNIYGKIGVYSRAEAATYAVRHGLL
jgi:DNA-binding CsgD family transcriptional regulator